MLKAICASGVFFGVIVVLSGCYLPSEPVWLGDSSSFIYAKTDGSVVQYDVAKAASRTLQPKGDYRPCRVAISPSGDRAAIGLAASGPKGSGVGIDIYRLSDGDHVESKMLTWDPDSLIRQRLSPSSSYWCPSGRRILICYLVGTYQDRIKAVVYDLEAKSLQRITGKAPAAVFCAVLGVSPLRPDGKGYLATPGNGEAMDFHFVEWDGWEHKIRVEPSLQKLLDGFGDLSKAGKWETVMPLPRAEWQGSVLSFAMGNGTVRIDTQKQLATYVETGNAEQRKVLSAEKIFDVAEFHDGRYQIVYLKHGEGFRVELREPSKDRSRPILDTAKDYRHRSLVPSPDRKHVLVQGIKDGRDTILVVGSDGATLAELDCGPQLPSYPQKT